jgi:hypothetical protein
MPAQSKLASGICAKLIIAFFEILSVIAKELHEKSAGFVLAICTIGRLLSDKHWRGRQSASRGSSAS